MKRRMLIILGTMFLLVLLSSGCTKKSYAVVISTTGGGGTVPEPGNYEYQGGQSLTISATPASGWKFDGWAGDTSGSNVTAVIPVNGDMGIIARFSKIQHSVMITVIGEGVTVPSAGNHTYQAGQPLTIAATSAKGWKFDGWAGDASGSNATAVVAVNGNKGIIARFSKLPPVPKTLSVANVTVAVNPGKYYDIPFEVTDTMQNATIVGSFRASGGGGNDIVAWIAEDINYLNLINSHPGVRLYDSGQVTAARINLLLKPGIYHLVLSNTYSLNSSKNVLINVDLNWSELIVP